MSDINPNVAITDSAPVTSIGSGDGPASFDELDQLLSESDTKASKASKESKEAKAKAPPKTASEQDGASKDLRPDAKTKDVETKKTKGEQEGKEEGEGKALEKPKPRKTFKGKHQDQSLDLDEDTEFTVRVNGQDIPVKAKDLFENFSGKTAWDKKFSEVEGMKRQTKMQESRFQEQVGKIKEMFTEQDPTVRLFKMAALAGVSPMDFRKNFFNDMAKDMETYMSLDDDQRKTRDLEFENDYLKHQADVSNKSLQSQQAQAELERHVKGLLHTTGVKIESFVERLEQFADLPREQVAFLERDGKFIKGKPTPEFVVETIEKDALWNSIEDAFEGVQTDWNPQKRSQEILRLTEDAHKNGMKPKHMGQIVSELYGKARAKRVVENVEREREEHYSGVKQKSQTSRAGSSGDPVFFDELL